MLFKYINSYLVLKNSKFFLDIIKTFNYSIFFLTSVFLIAILKFVKVQKSFHAQKFRINYLVYEKETFWLLFLTPRIQFNVLSIKSLFLRFVKAVS